MGITNLDIVLNGPLINDLWNNNGIWCGVYKSNVEIINGYMQLNNGQLVFNLM